MSVLFSLFLFKIEVSRVSLIVKRGRLDKYLVLVLIAWVKEKREFFPHFDGPRRRYLRAHNYSNQGTQPLQEVSFRCFVCLRCKRKSSIFFDGDGIFGHPPSPSSGVIGPEIDHKTIDAKDHAPSKRDLFEIPSSWFETKSTLRQFAKEGHIHREILPIKPERINADRPS